MFKIGEFSKIAQVSSTLLRYYDEVGLLRPAHIDPFTGYRYYSVEQLPRLNRILALKDMGLTLDQIQRLLEDDISEDEIRGMLALKKAQIEQMLQDEVARLRRVESRLKQIDTEGLRQQHDIVLKVIPGQQILALRETFASFEAARQMMFELRDLLPARVGRNRLGNPAAIIHSENFEWENIDFELGYFLLEDFDETLTLPGGRILMVRTIPAVASMATTIRLGGPERNPFCYSALGIWMETGGYRIAGPGREVYLRVPSAPDRVEQAITEIQFPVEKIADQTLHLS
jgi:DNA-binding transcriptional MerR regulator